MKKVLAVLFIIASFFVCGVKGTLIRLGIVNEDTKHFKDEFFGFFSSAPKMVDAWARLQKNPFSTHNLTNLLVEWTRLDAQRSTKLYCGAILVFMVTTILGVIV